MYPSLSYFSFNSDDADLLNLNWRKKNEKRKKNKRQNTHNNPLFSILKSFKLSSCVVSNNINRPFTIASFSFTCWIENFLVVKCFNTHTHRYFFFFLQRLILLLAWLILWMFRMYCCCICMMRMVVVVVVYACSHQFFLFISFLLYLNMKWKESLVRWPYSYIWLM